MKKKYITPAVTTILVETSELMATSPDVIFDLPSGDIQGGENEEADAASYRTTLWN